MKKQNIRRGEVYIADLGCDAEGSEQHGVRPVVIMQNDIGNHYSTTISVVPLTSSIKKSDLPTHYVICNAEFLDKRSMALGEALRTIDKRRLICNEPIGILGVGDMIGVCNAVRENLGFDIPETVEFE